MYYSSSMTDKTSSGVKMHHESIEPEGCQMAKIGFLPSGGLVQSCVTLSQFSFKTAAFYTKQCMTHCFFSTLNSQELWLHLQCHFLCTRVHKALSNET